MDGESHRLYSRKQKEGFIDESDVGKMQCKKKKDSEAKGSKSMYMTSPHHAPLCV
jgi:hypothetical protein